MLEANAWMKAIAEEMHGLLTEASPGEASEIQELLESHQIRIVPNEEQSQTPFSADPREAIIRAHMPVLKRQLVMAYAYVMAYRELVRDATVNGRRLNVPSTPKGEQAKRMLVWAMGERFFVARALERGEALPDETVDASWFPEGYEKGSDERIAKDMFHTALAADLYHELAHIVKGHGTEKDSDAVHQEEEADAEAARLLVGSMEEGDRYFTGAKLSLALSQTYEVFLPLVGMKADPRHPPLVKRLRDAVYPKLKDPDHPVWAFVASLLYLHASISDVRPRMDDTLSFASFKDMFDYMITVFENPRGLPI